MCLRKNCSPVQVTCRHCRQEFCSKHIQCELHACPANLKELVVLPAAQPPLKVLRI